MKADSIDSTGRTTDLPPFAYAATIHVTFSLNADMSVAGFSFLPQKLDLTPAGPGVTNYSVDFRLATDIANAVIVSDHIYRQPPQQPPSPPLPSPQPPELRVFVESGPHDHIQLLSNVGITQPTTYGYTVTVTVQPPDGGPLLTFTSEDPEIVLPPPSTGP